MADHSPAPRRNVFPLLIAGLALVAVVLVIAGRLIGPSPVDNPGWQDALYSVLLAFTLDGTFLGSQNLVTLLGAFAAALVFYLALLGSLWVVFRRQLRAWRASRQRGHVVVVGDGEDAAELARALSQTVPVVLALDAQRQERRLIGIDRPAATADLAVAAGIAQARAVVVMLGDERRNAEIATALAGRRAGTATALWCRTGDRLMADQISAAEAGAARLLVFDDAQMLARDLFARHPAHAVAERMAAGRVHLLVVGFGRLGQSVAEEAIFSGLVVGLGRPMVTVIDREARWAETAWRAGRPGLDRAVDMAFIEAEFRAGDSAPALAADSLVALAARDDIARVTGIVICLGADADTLRFALALPALRRREGRYFAPAFMRLRDAEAGGMVIPGGGLHIVDPGAGVLPLGRPTRLLASDILDIAQRDAAAQRLHEAYSRGEGKSAASATDWNRLPETYRRANRRSADHIAAKLFSLGLTSEREAHEPVLVERHAHQRLIAPLTARDDDRLDGLAALEHQRWSADRILDGWSYGAVRDDDRRLHPLLERGDYAALAPVEQQKDRDQLRTILSSIVPGDGKGAMPELRVGLAGHRRLAPAEQQRAVAVLLEMLVPRLSLRDRVVTLVSPLAPGADMALTEALATALAGRVGALRLLVPEAVPYRVVLDVAAAEAGGESAETMLARRERLFARAARVDIVRLGLAGVTDYAYRRDPAVFEDGLRRANAYLARRCDLLAVLWDGAMPRGPGGTGELVAWWRAPQTIPPALDPGVSFARPAPADRESGLVIVTVERPNI